MTVSKVALRISVAVGGADVARLFKWHVIHTMTVNTPINVVAPLDCPSMRQK